MRTTAQVLVAAAFLAAAPAMAGTLADVHVINRTTGQHLPVFQHDGKLYVAGHPGDRYAVQVVNKTGARIMAVVSVDGVNVVTGETAAPHQSGYVFSPWQAYDIAGWRKNQNEIAAFYFTSLPDSYAARTDRPHNVGVIGVAVFREYTQPRPRPVPPIAPIAPATRPFEGSAAPGDARSGASAIPESLSRHGAAGAGESGAAGAPAPSAAQSADAMSPRRESRERIGTGHGEREASQVSYTEFRRASSVANELLTIHYDRYENLVARGIIPGIPRFAEPQPFPGNPRFVPDPRS
jgi:hypothetical protein